MIAFLEEAIHSIPTFGPLHSCSPDCWCHPQIVNGMEIERGEHTAYLFMHNVAH